LSNGSNVKCITKLHLRDKSVDAAKQPATRETVSAWELEKIGTAFSIGWGILPSGSS
jgi:hypothetical protein